jgi:hypothetical protein
MFISYKYRGFLKEKDGKNIWKYELTDSEFGTVSGEAHVFSGIGTPGTAIIQEYSKRNLNVAANLIKGFIWYQKQHPYWSIQHLINVNKKYNPLLKQYEEDLEKYLPLL